MCVKLANDEANVRIDTDAEIGAHADMHGSHDIDANADSEDP